ncbi:MAG: NAD(P)-dependent alcohol dehydrogenase [Myxococcota bacterium]
MRAWSLPTFGAERLQLVDVEPQPVGPTQVRLRVEACSLNYRDYMVVEGHYDPRLPLPLVPLSDGAGRVTEVGETVEGLKIGDRVAATFFQDWEAGPVPEGRRLRRTRGGLLPGMLQEEILLDQRELVRVPAHLNAGEAASLPCAGVTAWSALIEQGRLTAGDTLLVQGTGGVALFALGLAKMVGAEVAILSSSPERLERALALGADHGVCTKDWPEWGDRVRKLTGGVTHVLELGGADTLTQTLRCVRPGGYVALVGVLGGTRPHLDLLSVVMRNVRLQGVIVGSRQSFLSLNRALEAGGLHPAIDRRVPFEGAKDALASFGIGGHFGKVVIELV